MTEKLTATTEENMRDRLVVLRKIFMHCTFPERRESFQAAPTFRIK
jgi:hypothetical protein